MRASICFMPSIITFYVFECEVNKYKDYLKKITDLLGKVLKPETNSSYPESLNSAAKRALYDNLGKDENLAIEVDKIVRATKKDGFRGNRFKEREIELAIRSVLSVTDYDAKQILELVKNQSEY